jgi:hypothetical protein
VVKHGQLRSSKLGLDLSSEAENALQMVAQTYNRREAASARMFNGTDVLARQGVPF